MNNSNHDSLVLLHGFPHTPRVWDLVVPALSERRRVLAPELVVGGDAMTLAARVVAVLDEAGVETADVVGLDAGGPVAVALARAHPGRVRTLTVVEALVGGLPVAEAAARPWWFGFHQVPGLAERVLAGHEAEYAGWFLGIGMLGGRSVPAELRDAMTAAYARPGALAASLEHYRAMPRSAEQLAGTSIGVPVLAVGAHPLGAVVGEQFAGVAPDLTVVRLEDCGHLVPLDAPDRFLAALVPFLDRAA